MSWKTDRFRISVQLRHELSDKITGLTRPKHLKVCSEMNMTERSEGMKAGSLKGQVPSRVRLTLHRDSLCKSFWPSVPDYRINVPALSDCMSTAINRGNAWKNWWIRVREIVYLRKWTWPVHSWIQSNPFTLLCQVLLEFFSVKLKVNDLRYPKSTCTVIFLYWFMLCALANIRGFFFSL